MVTPGPSPITTPLQQSSIDEFIPQAMTESALKRRALYAMLMGNVLRDPEYYTCEESFNFEPGRRYAVEFSSFEHSSERFFEALWLREFMMAAVTPYERAFAKTAYAELILRTFDGYDDCTRDEFRALIALAHGQELKPTTRFDALETVDYFTRAVASRAFVRGHARTMRDVWRASLRAMVCERTPENVYEFARFIRQMTIGSDRMHRLFEESYPHLVASLDRETRRANDHWELAEYNSLRWMAAKDTPTSKRVKKAARKMLELF